MNMVDGVTYDPQPPIESIPALVDWLAASNTEGALLITQDKDDRTKCRLIIVNGDDRFLSAAGLLSMQFLEYVASRDESDTSPMNRAERRRTSRRK